MAAVCIAGIVGCSKPKPKPLQMVFVDVERVVQAHPALRRPASFHSSVKLQTDMGKPRSILVTPPDPLQPFAMADEIIARDKAPTVQISDDRLKYLREALDKRNAEIRAKERAAALKQLATDMGLAESQLRAELANQLDRLNRSDTLLVRLQLQQISLESIIAVHTGPVRDKAQRDLADILTKIAVRLRNRDLDASRIQIAHQQRVTEIREEKEQRMEQRLEIRDAELQSELQQILIGYQTAMRVTQGAMPSMQMDLSIPPMPEVGLPPALREAPQANQVLANPERDWMPSLRSETLRRIHHYVENKGWELSNRATPKTIDVTAEVTKALFGGLS